MTEINPYAPHRRAGLGPWAFVAASAGLGVLVPLAGFALVGTPHDELGMLLILAGPALGVVAGVAAVVPAFIGRRSAVAVAGGLAGLGLAALFGSVEPLLFLMFARGRQLRQGGRLELPPIGPGSGWAAGGGAVDLPAELRASVAAAWRENGRTEHASVAAFARLSLELVAVGAPPDLLVDAARDAVDEIRHTEATFGLARAIDGQALSPAPFPAASTAAALRGSQLARLTELAVTSLVDGALHEGVSARVLGRLVERCEIPAIVQVLRTLSEDETRHAAHAWDVVDFCLRAGGEPVAEALRTAAADLAEPPRSSSAAATGAWEPFGIPGHALEREEYAQAVHDLRHHLVTLLRHAA